MFSSFRRLRKYATLHRMSREFAINYGKIPPSFEAMLRRGDEDDRLLEEFYSLVQADKGCSILLAHYGADRVVLEQIFKALMQAGAGQWAGKRFIPFLALAEPWTLEYLLRHRSRSFKPPGIGESEAFHVVVFYQDRKPLEWLQA
jgi:hypothetical protein